MLGISAEGDKNQYAFRFADLTTNWKDLEAFQ